MTRRVGRVQATTDRTEAGTVSAVPVHTARAEDSRRTNTELMSRMSHELRTPLNAILGFSQLLEMDDLTPQQRENVGYIAEAGRHLLELINDVDGFLAALDRGADAGRDVP
jgi:signal transduction histidine kinase